MNNGCILRQSGTALVESELVLLMHSSAASCLRLGDEVSIFFRYQVSAAFFYSIARHIHDTSFGLLSIVVLLIVLFCRLVGRLNLVASGKHKARRRSFSMAIRLSWTAETLARCVGSTSVSTLVEAIPLFVPGSRIAFVELLHQFFSNSLSFLIFNVSSDIVNPFLLYVRHKLVNFVRRFKAS
jgi:hypothetical protein